MDEITKALEGADLGHIAELLYGDGAYEIVKALSPEQKKRRDTAMQNIALGTNAVGAVAGPAALGLAWRSRKEGGTPRAYAPNVANAMKRSKSPKMKAAGRKIQSGVNALNSPKSKGAKIAAGTAGATLVGLQGVNWGGDILSAKLISDQKKKNQVKKSIAKAKDKPREERKVKLVRLGADAAFDVARTGPMVASKVSEQRRVKKSQDEMDIRWQGEISKMDTDKRQVFGWASIVEVDGKPFVDLQGDVMDLETIEKAAYDYVRESRKGGNQHERVGEVAKHVSDMVESFLVTPEKKQAMGLPDSVPTGWWVGFQVNDDDTWAQVRKGERTEFSIHGSGVRKSVELED